MELEIKITDKYIHLTLEESSTEVTCGMSYAGKPEELVAMVAYALKKLAEDMHIEVGVLIATLYDTIKLMDREEIKK